MELIVDKVESVLIVVTVDELNELMVLLLTELGVLNVDELGVLRVLSVDIVLSDDTVELLSVLLDIVDTVVPEIED